MTEWFTPQQAGYVGGIGGAVLGTLGGVYGAACGILAFRGVGKRAVLTLHKALLIIGVLLIAVGVTAMVMGQPYHVSYPFVLVGLVMTLSLGGLYFVVRERYKQAGERKMQAEELRRG